MDSLCATPATPTAATSTGWLSRLLSGNGIPSWGRTCSAVALAVAVAQEFRDRPVAHLVIWLGVATGSFTVTKIAEMVNPTPPGCAQ